MYKMLITNHLNPFIWRTKTWWWQQPGTSPPSPPRDKRLYTRAHTLLHIHMQNRYDVIMAGEFYVNLWVTSHNLSLTFDSFYNTKTLLYYIYLSTHTDAVRRVKKVVCYGYKLWSWNQKIYIKKYVRTKHRVPLCLWELHASRVKNNPSYFVVYGYQVTGNSSKISKSFLILYQFIKIWIFRI